MNINSPLLLCRLSYKVFSGNLCTCLIKEIVLRKKVSKRFWVHVYGFSSHITQRSTIHTLVE